MRFLPFAVLAFAHVSPAAAQSDDPIKGYIDGGFKVMDKSGDGNVTLAEFDTFMRGRLAKQSQQFDAAFAEIDKSKDGGISKEEAKIHPDLVANFAALDRNSDGKIGKDELRAAIVAAQMVG